MQLKVIAAIFTALAVSVDATAGLREARAADANTDQLFIYQHVDFKGLSHHWLHPEEFPGHCVNIPGELLHDISSLVVGSNIHCYAYPILECHGPVLAVYSGRGDQEVGSFPNIGDVGHRISSFACFKR